MAYLAFFRHDQILTQLPGHGFHLSVRCFRVFAEQVFQVILLSHDGCQLCSEGFLRIPVITQPLLCLVLIGSTGEQCCGFCFGFFNEIRYAGVIVLCSYAEQGVGDKVLLRQGVNIFFAADGA